jgi:hypothetical protein
MATTSAPSEKKVDKEFNLNTANLFDKPAYSDVTIKLLNKSIHCHKVIICTNSAYFAELCSWDANFKVSNHLLHACSGRCGLRCWEDSGRRASLGGGLLSGLDGLILT